MMKIPGVQAIVSTKNRRKFFHRASCKHVFVLFSLVLGLGGCSSYEPEDDSLFWFSMLEKNQSNWRFTSGQPVYHRMRPSLSLLPDGKVFISGWGWKYAFGSYEHYNDASRTYEIFDPLTESFEARPYPEWLLDYSGNHVLMPNGYLLLIQGLKVIWYSPSDDRFEEKAVLPAGLDSVQVVGKGPSGKAVIVSKNGRVGFYDPSNHQVIMKTQGIKVGDNEGYVESFNYTQGREGSSFLQVVVKRGNSWDNSVLGGFRNEQFIISGDEISAFSFPTGFSGYRLSITWGVTEKGDFLWHSWGAVAPCNHSDSETRIITESGPSTVYRVGSSVEIYGNDYLYLPDENIVASTVTPLLDNTILVAGGGYNGWTTNCAVGGTLLNEAVSDTYIVDPRNMSIRFAGALAGGPRTDHSAIRLSSGQVLVLGGRVANTEWLHDYGSGFYTHEISLNESAEIFTP